MLTVNFSGKNRTPLEQLLNVAKSNKLYDQDVLDTMASDDEKLKYLKMLSTANSLALDTRMASDGFDYQSIDDKTLKYQVLETEYELAIQQNLDANEQYQGMMATEYSDQINKQFGEDTRISGNSAIKTVVDTRYGGNYAQFMSEYKDDATFFNDEYLAFADAYDEDETRETLKYMRDTSKSLKTSQDVTGQLLARKALLLENIAADRANRLKREAYENASWAEKAGSAAAQMLLAPITELGNVLEGVMDAVIVTASGIAALMGGEAESDALKDFMAKDTIPLDTLLSEALPNSYITSPYSNASPLKWLYEIETSIIDMAPLALNIVAPGVGSFIYYTSSAGRTAESYTNEYADAGIGEIIAYTSASTAIEIITERLSGDVVFGAGFFDNWDKLASGRPVLRFLKEMAGEGFEEIAAEIGSQATASILRGENKFDGKQVLKAGALGAATSMFLQGGSTISKRRRMLGVNTRLVNHTTGSVIELSGRESAIVNDFMERSNARIEQGKTLSKRDQQLYDSFKNFEFGSYIDKNRVRGLALKVDAANKANLEAINSYTYTPDNVLAQYDTGWNEYSYGYSKRLHAESISAENEYDKYLDRTETQYWMENLDGRNVIHQQSTRSVWEQRTQGASIQYNEISQFVEAYDKFINMVSEGASEQDLDAAAAEIMSDEITEQLSTEMQQMAGVWTNALLAADENNQDVLTAVNNYYNSTLESIVERMNFQQHPQSSARIASKLSRAVNANITITTERGAKTLRSQLIEATRRAYPAYALHTFVSDSNMTPVVAVIDNMIFVDHRYIRDTNITSVIKQIEMQVTVSRFYESLNENTRMALHELQQRMLPTSLLEIDRSMQLQKQIVYSALFVPGNELNIQLSELDHTAYTALKNDLIERAKSQNIAIRNVAYRGLKVYDLTILSRLSADEAVAKNLLTGNHTVDELMSIIGPDKERYTFKYGIDASVAGVRVLSAIRHLADNYGFATDISNFYQALSDITNPKKYSRFEAFQPVLAKYGKFSYQQAINLYLRDQFDFEIDARGNILAIADVKKVLDPGKVAAAFAAGRPVALKDVLTPEGIKLVSPTGCVITFVDAPNGGDAAGVSQTSIQGRGLIQIKKSLEPKYRYRTIAHEIQHYFTFTNHQPLGATALFRPNAAGGDITSTLYKSLPETERAQFLRDMCEFIVDSTDPDTDLKNNRQSYGTLAKFPDEILTARLVNDKGLIDADTVQAVMRAVYWRYDVDETQSNFHISRVNIDAPGAYFTNTGIGPIVLRVNAKGLTGPAEKFLMHFNNKSILIHAIDTDAILNSITHGTTTFDELIASAEEPVVSEIAESLTFDGSADTFEALEKALALHGARPTVQQLCQPTFWAAHCADPNLKARVASFTPKDCKLLVSQLTGLVFDDFQGKFVKPTEVFKSADYVKHIDTTSFVSVRDNHTVIQLPTDYTTDKYANLDRALNSLTAEQIDTAVYYVDDRIFTNMREAIAFTDASPVSAAQTLGKPNNPLLAVFDQFIDKMIQTGFTHNTDFVFITHDGKVVSYDAQGMPGETFRMFMQKLNMPWQHLLKGLQVDPTTGKYVGNLETGIMKQLLDAKKIMRAYRVGNTWEAYGKPNYKQDLLLRQLNTTNTSASYLTPGDGIYEQYITGKCRLVTNGEGKVAIDRGRYSKYPEVSWKNNAWYGALMQIIEKYDIRKVSELEQLGFNKDFIDNIKRNYGRAVQGKTVEKLGLGEQFTEASRKYSGLEQDVINAFINDTSVHTFARNLLIQNAQARKSTENLNWALCSHMRSVEDIDAYFQALIKYSGTLRRKQNNKRYASLEELVADVSKETSQQDAAASLLPPEKIGDISYDLITSLFLNLDSRQESKTIQKVAETTDETPNVGGKRLFTPEGLDYSLSGFQVAAGSILRGYAASTKSADAIGGKTVSSDQEASGRHADDETSVNLADTSSAAIAKSILESAETKLNTQENLGYLKTFKRGIEASMAYLQKGKQDAALAALGKLQSYLVTENAKVTEGEGNVWDTYLKQLHDNTAKLIKSVNEQQSQKEAVKQSGLDTVIADAKQRIESAEDKYAAQDTEYQMITSNRARLIYQYGERGYQKALEALSAKAIFGEDTKAKSNVKDNISKRLRDTGSASIYARIDKYFTGEANTKFKGLADNLKAINDVFRGVKAGTEGQSTVRLAYSNLLTKFYKFLEAPSSEAFNAIKAERLEIARYLDNIVLYGDYDFTKIADPGIALYVDAAEQLISGNITMEEFAEFKDTPIQVRVQVLQALIDSALELEYPRPIIDRMRRILQDAVIVEETTEAINKPRIDLSALKLAQQRAGLSEETTSVLTSTVDKLNTAYSENKADKAKMSEVRQEIRAASDATFTTKYMTWTYDRLSKEYRKYLDSPSITQEDAEKLIAHAAEMIKGADYMSTSDAFRKKANKAWKNENSETYRRVKALIYYGTHGKWPKYYTGPTRGVDMNNPTVGGSNAPTSAEIELALGAKKQYIDTIIATLEKAARDARMPQKSALVSEKLSEENQKSRTEYVRQYTDRNLYEELTRQNAAEDYAETTDEYTTAIERDIKRYFHDTRSTETVDYFLAQMGYLDDPLSDPVKVREIHAILDLYIARLKGDISQGTYIYKRDQELLKLRLKTLDAFVQDAVDSRKAQLQASADAQWWNSYVSSKDYIEKSVNAQSSANHTYAVPKSHRISEQVKSVDDLLNMYTIDEIPETPNFEALPPTVRYYTTHRTFDDIIENALTQMKKYNTNEVAKLNGIINGVSQAITEFQYRPMTLASAIKFLLDIRTILQDGTLNQTLFSWKQNKPTEKAARVAFAEFSRSDAERAGYAKSKTGEEINTWKSQASGTSVTSIQALLEYLESGKFTSHAQELEQELQKSVNEISGAVQTLVETMKDATVTKADEALNSDLSRKMRNQTEVAWDEMEFEDEEADPLQAEYDAALADAFAEETSELLSDADFEMDFDETESETEEPEAKTEEPNAKTQKTKKEDTRPIEAQFKPEDEASRSAYKTTRSELLTRNGVDIARALEYQFQNTTDIDVYGQTMTRQQVNTQEFITNPEVSKILRDLLSNEQAMKDYLAWLAESRAIDEITSLKALIILNKIEASPTVSFEIRKEAQKIRKYKKSIAGAILGLGNRHGLTPVEEVSMLAGEMLPLTDDDKKMLEAINTRQDAAIKAGDFKAADAAMKEALTIFQKYQHLLDVSINPFGKMKHSDELAKAKTELANANNDVERKAAQEKVDALITQVQEERAIKWHNLTSKITTWRYFAMLSAPSTFFAKNVVGNYVAQGMNRASTALAAQVEKLIAKKRGFKYTNTNGRASAEAVAAVNKQLVESGLLDGIMDNTVARYDTGYKYKPSAVRNVSIDAVKDEIGPSAQATLQQVLRADKPFGKMNAEGKTNIFAEGLNRMYGIIFGTMNKYDAKFMRADILRLTERLVSNNFNSTELAELTNGNMTEATQAKFYEIVEFARQEACKTYFRSQPKVYNDIMQLLHKYPMAQAIISTIMPFPRMVVNATMTALAYSPLGYLKMLSTLQHDKSMFANIRASQEFGKATTGSIAIAVGIMLAALGILDIDDEDPYTGPQLVVGDLRIALEGLEPSAVPLITGAMCVLGPKYDNTGAFKAAADALLETTVLGELMNQFGNDSTATNWAGSLFASYVTQFIPTVLRRVAQLIDPGKKNYAGSNKMLKRIAAAIPLLSMAIENKIDPYTGDTELQYTDAGNEWVSRFLVLFNAISPTKISWDSDSTVEKESENVGAATTGPTQTIQKDGVEYKIPKKLYNQYKILRAQLYSQYASELIATDAYKKLSNEKKAQKLKALQTRATNEARKQLNITKELNIR